MLSRSSLWDEEDKLLVESLRDGDELAWQKIFDKYHEILFRKAFDLLDNKAESKDVVQELFIALWEKRSKLSLRGSSLEPYLYTAIKNRCLDRRNSIKVYNKHIEGFAQLHSDDNFYGPAENKELQFQQLAMAIHQVSTDVAFNSFKLMKFEQKNYLQAAKELGIHPGTVRKHVSHIYTLLRKIINSQK